MRSSHSAHPEWRLLGDSVRPRQTLPGRDVFPQWWLSELEHSQWMFTFVSQADFYFILCCSSWPLGSTKAVAQKLWSLGVSKSCKNNVSYCITVRWCYGDCCSPLLQPHLPVSVNTNNVGFLPSLCFFFFFNTLHCCVCAAVVSLCVTVVLLWSCS